MDVRTVRLRRESVASPEFARETGATWAQAFPPRPLTLDEPRRFGPARADFFSKLDDPVPAVGLVESDDLLVAGKNGWIVRPDGTILIDHTWYRGHAGQMPLDSRPLRVEHLRGTAISLASDWSATNYGHFLLDSLPRIAIAERLGYDLQSIDHVIVGIPNLSCRALLARLQIDPAKIVSPQEGVAFAADRLIAPTFPGARRNSEPWACAFLYERLAPKARSATRRLFIRRTTRKPLNEERLVGIAQRYGFEVYEPDGDPQQAETFARASHVVGAHGAALASVVFCPPEATVFELVPSDHVFPYYLSVCAARELTYQYILGRSVRTRSPGSIGSGLTDFRIDESGFAAGIAAIAG